METTISHFSHAHKLIYSPVTRPYYCQGCNQMGLEPASYKCQLEDCNFFLHEGCAKASLDVIVNHPFSKKCKLKFHKAGSGHGSKVCDACANKVNGFHYSCLCGFHKRNLHPFCLHYNQSLQVADDIVMTLQKSVVTACLHCREKDLSSKVRGWGYVSACEEHSYHVSCVRDIVKENWKKGVIEDISDPCDVVRRVFSDERELANQPNYKIPKTRLLKLRVISSCVTGNTNEMTRNVITYV